MRRSRWVLFCWLLMASLLPLGCSKKGQESSSSASVSETSRQQSLVGVWDLVKSDDMPEGLTAVTYGEEAKMTVEFTKDGKFTVKITGAEGRKKPQTFTL